MDHAACPATEDEEVLGFRMGKKRKMNELLYKQHVGNRRDNSWDAVLKEDVLSLVFDNADVAVLGVLVMDEMVVSPLRCG